jgi:hypothetical protein
MAATKETAMRITLPVHQDHGEIELRGAGGAPVSFILTGEERDIRASVATCIGNDLSKIQFAPIKEESVRHRDEAPHAWAQALADSGAEFHDLLAFWVQMGRQLAGVALVNGAGYALLQSAKDMVEEIRAEVEE